MTEKEASRLLPVGAAFRHKEDQPGFQYEVVAHSANGPIFMGAGGIFGTTEGEWNAFRWANVAKWVEEGAWIVKKEPEIGFCDYCGVENELSAGLCRSCADVIN